MSVLTISPTLDCHIRLGVPDTAGETTATFLGWSAGSDQSRRIIEQYSLSTVTGYIVSARLRRVVVTAPANAITCNIRQWVPPATEAEATWNSRSTGVPWTAAGGDYDPLGTIVSGISIPTVTTGERFDDVTVLVRNAAERKIDLYLIHSDANEGSGSARETRFGSRTNSTESNRPYLEVTVLDDSTPSRRRPWRNRPPFNRPPDNRMPGYYQ